MPDNTLRVELSLGVVYMTSVTPLIEAIEQAALSATTREEAKDIARQLDDSLSRIRREIFYRIPWIKTDSPPIEDPQI